MKNFTARELHYLKQDSINIIVYGINFNINIKKVDDDFFFSLENFTDHYTLLTPWTLNSQFQDIFSIRKSLEQDLDSLYNKINDFKTNRIVAFEKYYDPNFEYIYNHQGDFNQELYELKYSLLNGGHIAFSSMNEYVKGFIVQDTDFMIQFISKCIFKELPVFFDYQEDFQHLLKEDLIRILYLSSFYDKFKIKVIEECKNREEILFEIQQELDKNTPF